MKLFKRRQSELSRRIRALEYELGLVWANDGYGGKEYIERKWGTIPELKKDVKGLMKKDKK